jgi:hypothetical protein
MPSSHDDFAHLHQEPTMPAPKPTGRSYGKAAVPSRKWFAATVIGLGTIGVDWATAGHWTQTLSIAAIGFGVQRCVAYFLPNTKES